MNDKFAADHVRANGIVAQVSDSFKPDFEGIIELLCVAERCDTVIAANNKASGFSPLFLLDDCHCSHPAQRWVPTVPFLRPFHGELAFPAVWFLAAGILVIYLMSPGMCFSAH